jgi:branched-chain amino acid transport system permease protein
VLAGLVVGLAESFASFYLGSTYADVVSFGLLVLVLVVRPAKTLRAA